MADVFASHVFVDLQEDIPDSLHGDPVLPGLLPPHAITERETRDLLSAASNLSAAGASGVGWFLLQRAWGNPDAEGWKGTGVTFTHIFDASDTTRLEAGGVPKPVRLTPLLFTELARCKRKTEK